MGFAQYKLLLLLFILNMLPLRTLQFKLRLGENISFNLCNKISLHPFGCRITFLHLTYLFLYRSENVGTYGSTQSDDD